MAEDRLQDRARPQSRVDAALLHLRGSLDINLIALHDGPSVGTSHAILINFT